MYMYIYMEKQKMFQTTNQIKWDGLFMLLWSSGSGYSSMLDWISSVLSLLQAASYPTWNQNDLYFLGLTG